MKRGVSIFLALLIAAGFCAGGLLNHRLIEQRRALHITQADPLMNAPPLVVFTTVALGGFRGLLADFLWIRLTRLQMEGRFFELVQLADWITKLEPRFTDVWAYHAWNLSYNISFLFEDHADRWRWVRHGLQLLRDEGLKYNPGDAGLYYELGWLFQHKLGSNMDEAHLHYKKSWATEMDAALGKEQNVRDYKLEPEKMRRLETAYGPLEWRLPFAHAVYWASESRAASRSSFDTIMAQRMLYQSLIESFRSGRLFCGDDGQAFVLSPALDMWRGVVTACEESMAMTDDQGGAVHALRFFLSEAAFYLHLYGRFEEAGQCLARLKTLDPEMDPGLSMAGFMDAIYANPDITQNREATFAMIESSLFLAARARASGDAPAAEELTVHAQSLWNQFMDAGTKSKEQRERTGLPPLDHIRASAEARLDESYDERK